jgi:hypothetical protein
MARPSAAVLTRNPSLERARDEFADLTMIVDDQDVRRTLHVCNIGQRVRHVLRNVCRIVAAAAPDKLCHKNPCS